MLEARTIWFLRLGQLVTAILFSFIVLGLAGNIISKVPAGFGISAPDYANLSLATAVLTLVAIVPVMIIDLFRQGAVSSFVVTEISWLSLLTILWLAAAADSASVISGITCPSFDTECHEAQAITAFTWLNFFNLGAWLVFLITAASIAHSRGNTRVWFSPVTGTEFFAPAGQTAQSENAVEYAPAPPQQYAQGYVDQQGYPPQMQQQFTGDAQGQPPIPYPPNNGYNAGAQV